MAVHVTFELRLEERRADRVFVSVLLAPADAADGAARPSLDGVSVQIFQRDGEAVSPRLLLPISGTLAQPMITTVELRADGGVLPAGSRVLGHAWSADVVIEASCPTDMWTELGTHVQGTRNVCARSGAKLRRLAPEERARLACIFPWMANTRSLHADDVLEPEDTEEEEIDAFCAEYGLDGDDAEFLKELLADD